MTWDPASLGWTLGSALAGALGAYLFLKFRRIVPLERLAREGERLTREVRTLSEVSVGIGLESAGPQASLGTICSIVAKAVQADLCAFVLLEEPTGELVTQPGAYGLPDEGANLYRVPLTQAESSSVRVFKSGEPFITGDAQEDPRVLTRFTRLWKIHSLIVVPLKFGGRSIGVLRVGSFKRSFFTPDHLELVALIAEEAAALADTVLLTRRLQETTAELKRLSHLKDEFVSMVSHEFKTPLTAIKGFLTVLLEGEAGPLTDDQKRFLGIAKSASNRLTVLVSELLDLSRLEGGLRMQQASCELGGILRSSVEHHSLTAREKDLRLETDIPPDLVLAWADSRWTEQVVDNLLSNALKFTPKGGRVTVRARNRGDWVSICVEDTGPGISPQDRDRVFEKFYRAPPKKGDPNPPGTGLGLAIAKSIVDKHGGEIWVESEPGQGSKFFFVLPVAKGREGLGGPGPAPASTGRKAPSGGVQTDFRQAVRKAALGRSLK